MRFGRTIFAGLILWFSQPKCAAETGSPWRFWDSLDGFVESYTSSLAVNPAGGIWAKHGVLGNIELLNGYEAQHNADPGATGELNSAPDGTLWMWSGKGLSRFADGKWNFFYLDEVVRSGNLRSNSRELWDFTSYESPFFQGTVHVVALDRSHALVMLPDRVLEFTASPVRTRVVLRYKEAGMRRFTALRRARDGSIYLTGMGGLLQLQGSASEGWRWAALPRPPSEYTDFDSPVAIRPQELFVAGITRTLTADALRFNGHEWEVIYKSKSRLLQAWPGSDASVWVQDGNHILELVGGLQRPVERTGALSGILLAVLVESPGRFWVASSQGLSRYLPSLWRTPAEAPPLDDLVNAITEDKSGNIWFLAAGQLIRFDNHNWSTYPLPKGEVPWAIFTEGLAALPDGRIAIGVTAPHMLLFDPARKTFEIVHHAKGRTTRLFVRQPDGKLLVEVYSADSRNIAVESFDGHEFRPVLSSEELGGMTDLRSMVATPDKSVWLGATASFGIFRHSRFNRIGAGQGFTDPGAYFIYRHPSGTMFAGGRDALFRREGEKWSSIRAGLDRVRSIITARDGTMWIASGAGVHRYRDGIWISQGIEEGLPSTVAYKVFQDSKGRIWAGTTRGLSLYHPDADADPPVVTLVDGDNPHEAPPGGQVRLALSGVDKWKFTPRARLLFSYRVDGGNWSTFATADSVSLDKLAGGKHRFEVRAMDRNGNISLRPAVHEFAVLFPWYEMPQFLALSLVAAGIIIMLLALAYSSYAHRGALIDSLNQKNKLERARQQILERIARREPLRDILEQITYAVAEHCGGAGSLLIWSTGGSLEIFSSLALLEHALRTIRHVPFPEDVNTEWWARICALAGGHFRPQSPMVAIRSGDPETVGAIGVLVERADRAREASQWLLETFSGLAAAAIENARLYERLAHQARHDVLTELPNRLCFDDKLHGCVATARATGQPLAVFYLDLDRFKQINDTLGHRIGDLFLREVSRRLSSALHGGATLARIGGDEFTVLLEYGVDKQAARELAEKMLGALRLPIRVEGHDLFASASIGISLFPDDGSTPMTLQKNADIAMYRAKARGKNCLEFFSAEMGSKTVAALNMEHVIRRALDEQSLELFYQPQVTPDGELIGLEALIRLRRPGGGYIGPSDFIGVAEDTGLIVPVGAWVLREACSQLRQWMDAGKAAVRMCVNVSAIQIARESFASDVAAVLAEMRLPPVLLELELTESAIVSNLAESTIQMEKLRATGVRLAIDDFGAGYSSFAQLQTLPLDTLKIDRSFVMDLAGTARSPLIDSIVALGKSLGLSVIAEGIETGEQLAIVRQSRCDLVQGFLFSRPVPACEALEFLERGRLRPGLVTEPDLALPV